MSIFKRKQDEIDNDYVLALDIGTEYVKTLIARKDKKGNLHIVGVGKKRERFNNMHAGAIADIPGVVSVCEEALARAEEMAGVRAKNVVVGIAGELVKGDTSTFKYKRANPDKPITNDEMDRIIRAVQDKAGDKARREIAIETNNPHAEVRLINSAFVSLRIDGYKVSNPIGFKGTEVVVQIYTAYAPLVHISAIERVCDELQLDLLTVAVEPFAVCRACLGDDLESNLSCVVMDIGGGTTDIAVVNDGGVEGTKMFSIGGRSFTHQIATNLGLEYEDAEKLKLLADDPHMKETVRDKLGIALERIVESWQAGVELALEDFGDLDVLPDQICLCGGGSNLSAIPEYLATSNWYRSLPFAKRPVVNIIDPDEIVGVDNDTDRDLDQSFVTAIGLIRVGFDSLLEDGGFDLHDKLARLLKN